MEHIAGIDDSENVRIVSVSSYTAINGGELAIKRIINTSRIANKSQQNTFAGVALQTVDLLTIGSTDYAELTCLSAFHVSAGTITFVTLQVVEGANTIYLNGAASLAIGAVVAFNGSLIIKPGAILRVTYQVTVISPVVVTSAALTLHPPT